MNEILLILLVFGGFAIFGVGVFLFLRQQKLSFENLANRIFDEKQKHFIEDSQSRLTQTLAPVKEKLGEVQTKFQQALGEQAQHQASLRTEIQMIAKSNRDITQQADSLTKALKGDVKVQGNWGEIMLERVLESSGLREGEDYSTQQSMRSEEGKLLRPDVLVRLPQNRHVIIDAKLSLTDYERLAAAPDDDTRATHLQAFLESLRRHIQGLAEKAYSDAPGLETPDFVLMFLPIEGAYHLAMQQAPDLQDTAWKNQIIITCPATLFASLRVIAQFWREERQARNVEEIARLGGALHDKVAGFVEDMEEVGKKLESARMTHEQAVNKLSTGRGNILARTRKLGELGAKTTKELPPPDDDEGEASA